MLIHLTQNGMPTLRNDVRKGIKFEPHKADALSESVSIMPKSRFSFMRIEFRIT